MHGHPDAQMEGDMSRQKGRWRNKYMGGEMSICLDQWRAKQTDGWTDGSIDELKCFQKAT